LLFRIPLRSRTVQCRTFSANTSVVGVLGSGQMGTGIAKVLITTAKVPVLMMDKDPVMLDRAHKMIEKLLISDVAKTRITETRCSSGKVKTSNDHQLERFRWIQFCD